MGKKNSVRKKAPISLCVVLMQRLGYELNWETPSGTEKLGTFFVKGVFPEYKAWFSSLSCTGSCSIETAEGQCTQICEGVKSMGPDSFLWCPATEQGAQTETQEENEEKLL